MTRPLLAGLLLAFSVFASSALGAQCPNGSPPPCQPARRASAAPAPNSVAVLYFDNLTHDSAYAYLADGLTEDLITLLGRVARLDVKSRYESARVRGERGLGPSDIGRQLHVAYFVGGSVQPGNGRIRVNAELIDAHSGRRVWGEGLTALGTDPLAVQELITTAVVQAVVGQLLPEERAVLARRATRDSAAYDLYLRGQFYFSRHTDADLHLALDLFGQALVRDSTFALAWAGIAQVWVYLPDNSVPPLEAFPHVREAAERALALDSSVALAYAALAWAAAQMDFDFARGEQLARRAVALDPRLAEAHAVLGVVLRLRAKPAEALEQWRRVWELDSLSVTRAWDYFDQLILLGRSSEVLTSARRAPGILAEPAEDAVVWALLQVHECEEAQQERQRTPFYDQLYRGIAAVCVGDREGGRAAIDSLQAPSYSSSRATRIAEVYAALGALDSAFAWLERAYAARDYQLLFINQRAWWLDSLEADARFAALMRRIGLPWPVPELPN